MLVLRFLINITVRSIRVHSQRLCHPPNPTEKRELGKGWWLTLKSSPGPFINHNLKHVKPLHPKQILSQFQKLTSQNEETQTQNKLGKFLVRFFFARYIHS